MFMKLCERLRYENAHYPFNKFAFKLFIQVHVGNPAKDGRLEAGTRAPVCVLGFRGIRVWLHHANVMVRPLGRFLIPVVFTKKQKA